MTNAVVAAQEVAAVLALVVVIVVVRSGSSNSVTIIAICYNMIYISYKLGGALLIS